MDNEILEAFARLLPQLSAACRRGDRAAESELRAAWAELEAHYGRIVAPLEVFSHRRPEAPKQPRERQIGSDSGVARGFPATRVAQGSSFGRNTKGRWASKSA